MRTMSKEMTANENKAFAPDLNAAAPPYDYNPSSQNQIIAGLLLAMFAIIPNKTNEMPEAWRNFYNEKIMTSEPNKSNEQKQNADRDRKAQQVERNGFTAEEIGEESSYEDETETAQRMRRGDETKGDPDERDVVGAVKSKEVSPDISADKKDTE